MLELTRLLLIEAHHHDTNIITFIGSFKFNIGIVFCKVLVVITYTSLEASITILAKWRAGGHS